MRINRAFLPCARDWQRCGSQTKRCGLALAQSPDAEPSQGRQAILFIRLAARAQVAALISLTTSARPTP
jgi:hypothetical protein